MKKIQMMQNVLALATGLAVFLGSSFPLYAAQAALPSAPVITSFETLSWKQSLVAYADKPELPTVIAALPTALPVTFEGAADTASLPVTWECSADYANTSLASYEFTPVWDPTAGSLASESAAPSEGAVGADGTAPSQDAAGADRVVNTGSVPLPTVTVLVNAPVSSVCLMGPEAAKTELDTLTKSKSILALIYLCDSYDIKKNPGKTAETVYSALTGQSVRITGVEEDALRNIWYQVSLETAGASYTGYVERDYLAYSDEDLLAWEHRYISSYLFRSSSEAARDPYADVNAFPASYQSALKALKDAHPKWTFVPMNTGLDWTHSVKEENTEKRSLISAKVNAAWQTGSFDSSWSYPTDGILSYYMDPRNFLTAETVFQFELLSYNSTYHTQAAVQGMLDSTFMNGLIPGDSRTYAEAFFGIGQSNNVSPFHLAARIRVEQGAQGTSPLISGSYPGYEGVYNYFNIGATGQGNQAIVNGLNYARSQNWNTRYLALEGGSRILSQKYINKGQDTLYLQKFNVNTNSVHGAYNHQYMQNIAAPSTEANIIRRSYTNAGVFDKPFVFKIPVFSGMPDSACAKPVELKAVTLDKSAVTLTAAATASLTPYVDGTRVEVSSVTFTSSAPSVATVDANGLVTAVSPGSADIRCTMTGGTTAVCRVTVQKAEPAYTVPTLAPVTYDSAKTLGAVPLPSGWTWDAPNTVPTVNVSAYPATFTPPDPVNYNTVKKLIPLTVNKGTPSYTLPSGLQTVVGNTLASIRLPAGFTWESPSTPLTQKGTTTGKASYNPDSANYHTVTGIDLPVTVNEKAAECTNGHTCGEWEPASDASCTAAGSDTRSCHICGAKETRTIPALGHAYSAVTTQAPTEDADGVRTYTCARCGDSYTEVIPALPPSHTTHSYTAAVTKEASCTEKGVRTYTCSCGDAYTEDIAPQGHSYAPAVTKEPTETETGVRTYTCARCGDSYTETMEKLPASHTHSYASAVTKQASCTEKGVKTFTCSCGNTYTEEIPAAGHDMVNGKCTKCGHTSGSGSSGSNTGSTSGSGPGTTSGSGSSSSAGSGTSGTGTNPSAGSGTSGTGTNPSAGSGTLVSGSGSASGSGTSGSGSSSLGTGGSSQSGANSGTSGTNQGHASGTTGSTGAAGSSGSGSKNAASTGKTSSGGKKGPESVTVQMKENTVLYEETISSIRGKDVEVLLDMGDDVSWTVNGNNIVYDEANGVDMGVTLNSGNIPASLLASFPEEEGYTVILFTLAHSGPLDFKPLLTVHAEKENAGRTATLFYYNPEKNALEFVNSTLVDDNGAISYTMTHASDYAIIISDEAIGNSFIINETVTSEDEDLPITEEVRPENGPAQASDTGLNPAALAIIIFIVLILAAIGVTAYLMMRGRSQEDDEAFADTWKAPAKPTKDAAKAEEPVKSIKVTPESKEPEKVGIKQNTSAKNRTKEAERYLDGDSNTPVDDYHEPAVEKKAGKVISVKKKAPAPKTSEDKKPAQKAEEDKKPMSKVQEGSKHSGKKNKRLEENKGRAEKDKRRSEKDNEYSEKAKGRSGKDKERSGNAPADSQGGRKSRADESPSKNDTANTQTGFFDEDEFDGFE